MVPFTKEYFPICLLLSAPNFPIMIDPAQIACALYTRKVVISLFLYERDNSLTSWLIFRKIN
jgi:hypothetical protein